MADNVSSCEKNSSNGVEHNNKQQPQRKLSDTIPMESVQRLVKLPVVESSLNMATDVYSRVKEASPVLNWTLSQAETTMSRAVEHAIPVAERLEKPLKRMDSLLCSSLDYVESKVPAVKLPTQQLLESTSNYVESKLQPALDKAAELKQYGANKLLVPASLLTGMLTRMAPMRLWSPEEEAKTPPQSIPLISVTPYILQEDEPVTPPPCPPPPPSTPATQEEQQNSSDTPTILQLAAFSSAGLLNTPVRSKSFEAITNDSQQKHSKNKRTLMMTSDKESKLSVSYSDIVAGDSISSNAFYLTCESSLSPALTPSRTRICESTETETVESCAEVLVDSDC